MSVSSYQAYALHNPNLYVSAENSSFNDYFSGSMIVEVVVNEPNLIDTDEGKGEPDVTINGKDIRMVQASDGKWYAYFANKDKAKIADQVAFNGGTGLAGESLDFGVFCSKDTAASVLGISFSDTEGVAIPRSGGIAGATNGTSSFNPCTGSPTDSANQNNVVRKPKSPNTNSAVPIGQIGIDPDAWPVIQLFSFSNNVVIQYNRGGGTQKVELSYDEIPNISLSLDRSGYPTKAEVFVTISDVQLNQDPTDRDSWTFNIDSKIATFYQAFTETGSNSANGGTGLINLVPHLSSLDFEDNGKLTMNLGSVAELKTSNNQPASSVTDGSIKFSQIITLVESQPNSGIFENFDFDDKSTIGILGDAPRGQSATIEYNSKSTSIVAGTFTGSISLDAQDDQLNQINETAKELKDEPEAKSKIPDWIKNNAGWWVNGQIGDSDFINGIQYMITENIMVILDLPEDTQKMELKDEKRAMGMEREQNVPDWVRNNAGWWADGLISDDDFVSGIKYLVEQGIIRV